MKTSCAQCAQAYVGALVLRSLWLLSLPLGLVRRPARALNRSSLQLLPKLAFLCQRSSLFSLALRVVVFAFLRPSFLSLFVCVGALVNYVLHLFFSRFNKLL